jgi:hypothetical protein
MNRSRDMKWILPLLVVVLAGCHPNEKEAIEKKCDAPLRNAIASSAKSGSTDDLVIFGKCSGPIDDAQRASLTKAGANLRGVKGDLFAAGVPLGKIGAVATLDFVTQLSLSGDSKAFGP